MKMDAGPALAPMTSQGKNAGPSEAASTLTEATAASTARWRLPVLIAATALQKAGNVTSAAFFKSAISAADFTARTESRIGVASLISASGQRSWTTFRQTAQDGSARRMPFGVVA